MLCTLLLQTGGGAVVAALIATTVAAIGWLGKSLIGGMLYYLSVWGAELERLIALRAEVSGNVKAQKAYADDQLVARLRHRYEKEPDYRHFIPLVRENAAFDQIRKDITRLPEQPLQAVIDYYKASAQFDTLLAAFESERYEALGTDRKVEIFAQAVAAAKIVVSEGNVTLNALNASIDRRRFYRGLLVAGSIGLAVLAGSFGLSLAQSLPALTRCPAQVPGDPGALAPGQISGGRMGGLMERSPVSPERPAFYIVIAHAAINRVGAFPRLLPAMTPHKGRHA